jgi:DNA-binding HxlR family transcriptional regulator
MLVLRDLLSGKKRYSELQRGLRGISPRLLALRLRTLEQKGLLVRRVFPTNPPTTEYELTPRGRQLDEIFAAMARFGNIL